MNRLMLLSSLVVLAACGSSSGGLYGNSSPAAPAAASSSPTAAATIKTAQVASIGGVVVDAQGMTLYRLTAEQGGKIACTGTCTNNWPPLMLASGAPTAASGLSAPVSVVTRPDGSRQVTYNGWPLYHFAGDSAPGDAKGQGFAGKWFAVTPDVAAN